MKLMFALRKTQILKDVICTLEKMKNFAISFLLNKADLVYREKFVHHN